MILLHLRSLSFFCSYFFLKESSGWFRRKFWTPLFEFLREFEFKIWLTDNKTVKYSSGPTVRETAATLSSHQNSIFCFHAIWETFSCPWLESRWHLIEIQQLNLFVFSNFTFKTVLAYFCSSRRCQGKEKSFEIRKWVKPLSSHLSWTRHQVINYFRILFKMIQNNIFSHNTHVLR